MEFKDKFIQAVKICILKKYLTFRGRASRTEFWCFFLFYVLATPFLWIAGLSTAVLFSEPALATLVLLIFGGMTFLSIPPFIAVAVRRLHDTGKPWWLVIFLVIPFLNIVSLIFLAQKGDPAENLYGEPPLQYK